MKSKLLIMCCTVIVFTSCQLLPSLNTSETKTNVQNEHIICIWKTSTAGNDCKIEYWLNFWSDIEDVSWPERKKQIDALSVEDVDVLKKILLSQGKSTPYQDRLRAQTWANSILPKLSQPMSRFILVALYHPSQGLLELESALVTLSKINTQQSFKIEEQQSLLFKQQSQLNKQQSQIDQLLNIEASIMQSIEEDK